MALLSVHDRRALHASHRSDRVVVLAGPKTAVLSCANAAAAAAAARNSSVQAWLLPQAFRQQLLCLGLTALRLHTCKLKSLDGMPTKLRALDLSGCAALTDLTPSRALGGTLARLALSHSGLHRWQLQQQLRGVLQLLQRL
jgi:hypothetical protein